MLIGGDNFINFLWDLWVCSTLLYIFVPYYFWLSSLSLASNRYLYAIWLGQNVTLKDRKWAIAVDACLGELLTSFYCHDNHDKDIIKNICRQMKVPKMPTIVVSKFLVSNFKLFLVNYFRTTYIIINNLSFTLDILGCTTRYFESRK